MEHLWQDVRFGARVLIRNPALTLVAVLTLALGVGANAAIFTVVNAVLLRPLPYPHAEQLVQVWESDRQRGENGPVSPLNYRDWKEQSRTVDLSVYEYARFVLTGEGEPQPLVGIQAPPDFFRIMQTTPALGRLPDGPDDAPEPSVVLSNGLWQRQFGGRADVIGKNITLSGRSYTVTGVMPESFVLGGNVNAWATLQIDYANETRGNHYLYGIGRLRRGATLAGARSELAALAQAMSEKYPDTNLRSTIKLVPLRDQVVGSAQNALIALLVAVGFVLLIACANVVNVLLARASGRATEVAVRRALGADTRRLAGQFLTEALLLTTVGGVAGMLLADWGVELLVRLAGGALPRAGEVHIDTRVFVFTLALLTLIALVLGLAQAAALARTEQGVILRDSSRSSTASRGRQRTRALLAVAQLALALPLLTGATLLLRTVYALQHVTPGFQAGGVLSLNVSLPAARYPNGAQQAAFVRQALERINNIPGVTAAGMVSDLPFAGSRSTSSFEIDGRPEAEGGNGPVADSHRVSPGYFAAMNIPVVRGRGILDSNGASAPRTIVIDQALVARYFPDEEALGRTIVLYGQKWQVVGILGNVLHDDLEAQPAPEFYIPIQQMPLTRLFLAVRTTGDPLQLSEPVKTAVREVDPQQPAFSIRTMSQRLEQSIAPQRSTLVLLAVFASLAITLALVGLYGVISYAVAQRMREMGIRVALGAQPRDLARMVYRQSTRIIATGLGIGLALAVGVSRALRGLLFGVRPADPLTLAGVTVLLAAVALVACGIPVRRATRADPMAVLRHD